MRARLACFGTWLWKEWRDQRAVTIGILVAIPALTALSFWAFGDNLRTAWLHNTRAIFLGIGLGLVNFAVAASLVAGETRHATMQTLRRLPGGLSAAYLAKLAFLVLLVVVVIAWSGLCLALAEAGNGGVASDLGLRYDMDGGATRAMVLWEQILAFPTSELWTVGLGMGVLCLWTLLVSTWMGRSGVAGVGSIVLLGVLSAPFALLFIEHPYFFAGPWALAGWTAAISALAALVALSLSFLRGQRFAGRPLRPFLVGSAVLLVALGGGYAYAHSTLEDWLEVDPHHEDFRIFEAHVGAGGRYLYVTVHRGAPWIGDKNLRNLEGKSGWDGVRGTPLQAWVCDLKTGAIDRTYGKDARYFTRVPEAMGTGAFRRLEPQHAVVCVQTSKVDENPSALTWWDAATAKPVRTLPWGTRDPEALDLVRKTLAASSWLRDAQGRRVWLRDDILEVEGALEPIPDGVRPRAKRVRALHPVPGGWYGWTRSPQDKIFLSVDGEQRELKPDHKVSSWGHYALSGRHALDYERRKRPSNNWNGQAPQTRRIVVPLDGGPASAPKNVPEKISSILAENLVLALRGDEGDLRLHAWNPLDGADRPLAWEGKEPRGVASAMVYGRAGDGRMLLLLQSKTPARTAWAVLSPNARTARLIVDWLFWGSNRPLALLADDVLIVGEERKRVVRYVPGKDPEVLFPR